MISNWIIWKWLPFATPNIRLSVIKAIRKHLDLSIGRYLKFLSPKWIWMKPMQRANYYISCNNLMNRTSLTKACSLLMNEERKLVSVNVMRECMTDLENDNHLNIMAWIWLMVWYGEKVFAQCGARTHDPGITPVLITNSKSPMLYRLS